MAKILIISNYYPPIQSVATNRIVSFVKYLKEFGHEITVLTIGEKDNNEFENGIRIIRISSDSGFKTMDTNKKENKIIHYLKCLYNLIFMQIVEDEHEGWVKNATQKILSISAEESFAVVISSYPAMATMAVANVLKSGNSKIKWVADMRDAIWSLGGSKQRQKNLERQFNKIKKNIDVLLAVSKPQLITYKNMVPNQNTAFLELRNGYDFELENNNVKINHEFTIAYTGNFYGKRKPDKFLKALESLISEAKLDIKVRIIGNNAPINIPDKLKTIVQEENRVQYKNLIIDLQTNVDALLLVSPRGLEKGIYTGKVFDYLGCHKPILALVPKDDVAAQLIREARAGYIAENEDIEEIKKVILQAYFDWKNKIQFSPDLEVVKKHHRREQAKRLNEIILSITE